MKPLHIIVGMSGGVDSSVAAYLLQQEGHHVEAAFMKNWEEEDDQGFCPAEAEMADAQAICDKLNIALHRINFSEEYWQRVFSYFLAEYRAGRTPNPDVLCNKEIKFKSFLNFAQQRGADYIATGHYARTEKNAKNTFLLKGLDPNKDQSYFLHAVAEAQLAKCLFPIGHLEKKLVREIAEQQGFINAKKKDSTGICFIGERKFKKFLSDYLPAQPGNIETTDGKIIAEHDGLMFYTIGQRQGLQIGGLKDARELPWYVVDKDLDRNTLIIAQGHNHPALSASALLADQIHWINGAPPELPRPLQVKIRYRQSDQDATLFPCVAGVYTLRFDQPQRAITPGQSVVFYENDRCLGGGVILQKI